MKFLNNGSIFIPKEYLKIFLLSTAFFFSFLQISIANISVNYFFVLLPFLLILKDKKILVPHQDLLVIIISYFILFSLAALIQIEYWEIFNRKLTSFLLFLTAFCFCFSRVDQSLIIAFKIGTILFTLYLSIDNLIEYRSFDVQALGYAAKNQVGNQRYGFMYVFSFWLVLFQRTNTTFFTLLKMAALIFLFTGIFLTFSRASIVGFFASLMVLSFHYFFSQGFFNLKVLLRALIYLVFSLIIIIFSGYYEYLAVPFQYFGEKATELISGEGINLSNLASSEGYRVYLLREIINYVLSNPIFGSGFLGIWIILDDGIGSAHGQFNDVLFRSGFIGLFLYFYLLFRTMKFLRIQEFGMYIGFWGIIAYGLVHETFKLPHGSLLLAFSVGMWAASYRLSLNKKIR